MKKYWMHVACFFAILSLLLVADARLTRSIFNGPVPINRPYQQTITLMPQRVVSGPIIVGRVPYASQGRFVYPVYLNRPVGAVTQQTIPIYYNGYTPISQQQIGINNYPVTNEIDNNAVGGQHSSAGEVHGVTAAHFGYSNGHGPETWKNDFPACGGINQSPIDIVEWEATTAAKGEFAPIVRENYWATPDKMVYTNNGHTLEVSGSWPNGKTPTISGGSLGRDIYAFRQMHFHWGADDSNGSEHTVNGKSYPMELHVVHYNTKYGSYDAALNYKGGLTVVAYFFEISQEENPMVEKLVVRPARNLTGNANKQISIEPMPINVLNLDGNAPDQQYATYSGSLTTPPCLEIVTWLIRTEPITISDEQMKVMRTVVQNEEHEDIHNARPTQPRYGRQVKTFSGNNP